MKLPERISKNCYLGPVIERVEDLEELASNRRSVYSKGWGIKPAAVIVSMQTRRIIKMVRRRELFVVLRKRDVI